MRTTLRTGVLLLAGLSTGAVLGSAEGRAQQMGHQHETMQRNMSHMHEMASQMERIMERVHRLSERLPPAAAGQPGEPPVREDPVRQMSRSVMIMAVEMKSAMDACDRMARDPAMTKDGDTRRSVLRVHDDLMAMAERMEGTLGVLEGLARGWDERQADTDTE
jgi:Mg2+ and Co2+ transporter CorA